MIRGVLGDERHPGDAGRKVVLVLRLTGPEIFRKMVLASEETALRHHRVDSKGKTERNFRLIAFRTDGLSRKMEWSKVAPTRCAENCGVSGGIE
ncbi:hypothetical protein [Rhabdaerophilum sp. SD176]|uniref:hypothetical protein n=1 Tax=Rhabdaerophilum sp. SD176 TaxID=2983548 RepID=UPI0024DF58BC|nr:hypothetical protein [Rhabdaerophilum sp. SD176]